MHKEPLFKETQRFRQWWLWVLIMACNGIIFYAAFRQIVLDDAFGKNTMDDAGMIITMIMIIGVNALLLAMRLETSVYEEGIVVRFFPFHLKLRQFAWTDISSAEVRTYSPIREFGGWGLRIGLRGSGKAWNVSGNKGLQLVFKNRKKLLIGTQKGQEMIEVLEKVSK